YVVDKSGQRGVWFFSLDAASLLAVIGARLFYALPYYWARMSVERAPDGVRYRSQRAGATTAIDIRIGEPIPQPDNLAIFLTERWRLYAYRFGRIWEAEVSHPTWPLQQAKVLRCQQTLLQSAGLPAPQGEALSHFAENVDVHISALHEFR